MSQDVIFPNLSKTRLARGYTQRVMAALLGYRSSGRYAMYETGDRKPNVVEALRIAKVLGETVEYLFGAEQKQSEDQGEMETLDESATA